MSNESIPHVSAVERTMNIIHAISQASEPLGCSAIAKLVNLPKATVFRICSTLEDLGYLEKNDQDEFSLGLIFITLGERVKSSNNLADIAQPHLEALSKKIGETVNLGVRNDNYVFTLFSASGESSVLVSKLVPVAPLYCSALGKTFLCHMEEDAVQEYYIAEREPRTVNTLTTYESFQKEKMDFQANGCMWEREEYEYGLSCVAAPLYGHNGKIVAAISCSSPSSRIAIKGADTIQSEIKNTAEIISQLLNKLYIDGK